jgi:hypothetical protein
MLWCVICCAHVIVCLVLSRLRAGDRLNDVLLVLSVCCCGERTTARQ